MIVAYQPGGTVKDVRVVLKPNEKLPNRFNTEEAIIYRENPDNPRNWIMVKPKYSVLPSDSPLLSQPALPEVDIISLTNMENEGMLYEHVDIIRFDESSENRGDDSTPVTGGSTPLVP
jgi:hypothetical protein